VEETLHTSAINERLEAGIRIIVKVKKLERKSKIKIYFMKHVLPMFWSPISPGGLSRSGFVTLLLVAAKEFIVWLENGITTAGALKLFM